MKSFCPLLILLLCLSVPAGAQRHRKTPQRQPARQKTNTETPQTSAPRIIGSQVVLVTKNDERIAGTLLDLNAYSARIKADNLESSIALDTIMSISFSGQVLSSKPAPAAIVPMRPEVTREAENAIGAFQALASQLKTGADYSEYGRQLAELRR